MGGECILIVEDHAALLDAMQILLEKSSYIVLRAADGVTALAMLAEKVPNLIVADINMPAMDGYDLYEAVRANPEWHLVPFIFLTAKAEREDILRGKALGVDDYLVKPLDPAELLAVIRAKLDRTQMVLETKDLEIQQIKKQIVTAFSHEVRTPLTWIIAYAEMTRDFLDDLPPEQLREFLTHVLEGGDRITQVTNDLLTLIRLDNGLLKEELQQVMEPCYDVSRVVQRVMDDYEPRASVKGIRLQTDAATPIPSVVICETFLHDAVGRLVDNAIKFSSGAGAVVSVTTELVGQHINIAVTDQGIGIAPDQRSLLFTRFRQINRDKMEQQGLGLGLAIASELVALQGGSIDVDSAPGSGSTFTIRLPLAI
jgi:two-component system, sensor histidine kinase and response regulator